MDNLKDRIQIRLDNSYVFREISLRDKIFIVIFTVILFLLILLNIGFEIRSGLSFSKILWYELKIALRNIILSFSIYIVFSLFYQVNDILFENEVVSFERYLETISNFFLIAFPFIIEIWTGSFEKTLAAGTFGLYFEIIISIIVLQTKINQEKTAYLEETNDSIVLRIISCKPFLLFPKIKEYKILREGSSFLFMVGVGKIKRFLSIPSYIEINSLNDREIEELNLISSNSKGLASSSSASYFIYAVDAPNYNEANKDMISRAILFYSHLTPKQLKSKLELLQTTIGKIKTIQINHSLIETGSGTHDIIIPSHDQ